MSDNEIRFAIAEACGWVWYRHPISRSDDRTYRFLALPVAHEFEQSPQWMVRADGTERLCSIDYMAKEFHLPDYCKDLNAMHEAEKVLEVGFDGSQADNYHQELFSVVNAGRVFINEFTRGGLPDVEYMHKMICATAAQRAVAFLKTIGKLKKHFVIERDLEK